MGRWGVTRNNKIAGDQGVFQVRLNKWDKGRMKNRLRINLRIRSSFVGSNGENYLLLPCFKPSERLKMNCVHIFPESTAFSFKISCKPFPPVWGQIWCLKVCLTFGNELCGQWSMTWNCHMGTVRCKIQITSTHHHPGYRRSSWWQDEEQCVMTGELQQPSPLTMIRKFPRCSHALSVGRDQCNLSWTFSCKNATNPDLHFCIYPFSNASSLPLPVRRDRQVFCDYNIASEDWVARVSFLL